MNVEINPAKFTVIIGEARGAFDCEETAKISAMKLAYLNRPMPISIEDELGHEVFTFSYSFDEMKMTSIHRSTLVVGYNHE